MSPAIRSAAAAYRRFASLCRRSDRLALAFADDKANARRMVAALARGLDRWTDVDGRSFYLRGPSCGCQIDGPASLPGAWFGGAGF